MWIMKGGLVGFWLFAFGTLAFLYFAVFRPLTPGRATGVSVITLYTTQNPWWWAALVACIVLGFSLVRSWPGKGSVIFWVALIATSVVPVGLFGLFVFIAYKLKDAAGTGR